MLLHVEKGPQGTRKGISLHAFQALKSAFCDKIQSKYEQIGWFVFLLDGAFTRPLLAPHTPS